MLVKEVMSSNVAAVDPNTSVAVAARAMRRRVVGCLPVLEQGQVIGMVTDRDLVERVLAEGLDAHATTVRAVMSAAPVFCSAHQPIDEARRLMVDHRIKHLAVLGPHGEMVGMLAYGDVVGRRPKCRPQEVRFYRKMSTSSGHQHKVAIGTVWLSPAIKTEDVSAAAIRSFERDHKVVAWTQLADGYEVVDDR